MPKLRVEVHNTLEQTVDSSDMKEVAREVWSEQSSRDGTVGIVLVDDAHIIELNKRFFAKGSVTDVISFPLSDEDEPSFEGEIYICLPQVERQATEFNVSFEEELLRMVVHGMLHFLRFNDLTTQEKAKMRERENFFLKRRMNQES